MNSSLVFAVIWWCLSLLSGVLYLIKPHVYFLVAGSCAGLIALLLLATHFWRAKPAGSGSGITN